MKVQILDLETEGEAEIEIEEEVEIEILLEGEIAEAVAGGDRNIFLILIDLLNNTNKK